jgi:hypothetical protein
MLASALGHDPRQASERVDAAREGLGDENDVINPDVKGHGFLGVQRCPAE